MRVSRELNDKHIMVTLDILGEFIQTLEEAEQNKKEYLDLIAVTADNGIDGNFSLKPTSFGLLLDREVCLNHIREIVAKAESLGRFIRIDMEDSPCTGPEIELFRKLKAEFPSSVGLVLQAYLKRTADDIRNLTELNAPEYSLNFRLCKGIYIEPAAIAFRKHDEINSHYLEDLELMFQNGIYAGIATHDRESYPGSIQAVRKIQGSEGNVRIPDALRRYTETARQHCQGRAQNESLCTFRQTMVRIFNKAAERKPEDGQPHYQSHLHQGIGA